MTLMASVVLCLDRRKHLPLSNESTANYRYFRLRGVRIALLARDDYGSFIAFGISTMFGVQALVNLAVAMAILPTKGLTLPFVSYGGSSLLVNAVATGILLNVSRQRVESPARTPIVSERKYRRFSESRPAYRERAGCTAPPQRPAADGEGTAILREPRVRDAGCLHL